MADQEKEKKIIIDEDWKTEARKEKEKLAEEEKDSKAQAEQRRLPPADFQGLISMLATQAFFGMGLLRSEENKDVPPDMEMAKYNIDLLGILEEKTKGNLNEEEAKLFESTLHQLRMAYVSLSSKAGGE